MGERARPALYSIPAHRAFADALAAGLIARHGADPLGLAQGMVLLPNNRAVRAVGDAFVRASHGGLLLPRLVAIGDPELGERAGGALDPIGAGMDVPPAIEPMQRLMLLSRMVQEARRARGQPVDAGEAIRLGQALAAVLDQMHVEQVPASALAALKLTDALSAHWQTSLDLFELLIARWPQELARRGMIDQSDRRNRMFAALSARWGEAPPRAFVVAAGISTTAPAVAHLLARVATMRGGQVVFAGLDQHMDADEWAAIGPFDADPISGHRPRGNESHPQYALKLLLDHMGFARDEVARWRWGSEHDARAVRGRNISSAMLPPRLTGKWRDLKPAERTLSGVTALEVATPAEEAQAIAIALREALETPERTAALVTPDRQLATRVSAHLRRWGIEADDSAGRPLSQLPPGTLLIAIAEAVAERFAPVALLALLKHPLVRRGDERIAWLDGVRELDMLLRGPRPPAGLAGIDQLLAERDDDRQRHRRQAAREWWAQARTLFEPMEQAFDLATDLSSQLAAVRDHASALSGDQVWAGHQGHAAAALFAEMEAAAGDGPADADVRALPALLEHMLGGVAVHPPQGGHPRIAIFGLIEARLAQADLMILAGLNEGTWPGLPTPDPWLAPRIRRELGLPSLETRIGLSAHDFAGGLGGPQVLITRSRRGASGPAVASRFWLRLRAMTGVHWRQADDLAAWARGLDQPPSHAPAERPAPSPPLVKRPRTIPVTDVDRLKADPFAFYARRILRLAPLDPVDADPSAAWRGTAVHEILQRWGEEGAMDPAKLEDKARAMFRRADAHPLLRALWQPRLIEAIRWIAAQVEADREAGRSILLVEQEGRAEIAGVTLTGKADRIDRMPDGSLAIIDYKTGKPPSARQVKAGYALQLGLLGLIAEADGFIGLAPRQIAGCFEYWSLGRNKEDGFGYRESPVDPAGKRDKVVTADFTSLVLDHFQEAAAAWLTGEAPFAAQINPEVASYGEYDQLMRLEEWYGRGNA
ncbi:double-strand break repair protein AddB [Sphingobium sp. AN641]|uniref:double-strand break repair protein AddB n=1 Tax=Sphingobium sp. AN641 TaxID=3133443 RepID=UPI0030BBB644